MTDKIRHIDLYPDEFLAGVSGVMNAEEIGVYTMVCMLIYSRGGPIANDPKWLGNLMGGMHVRTVKKVLKRLETLGKITVSPAELTVNRCLKELERTSNRVSTARENGAKGGRPSKENKDIEKPDGLSPGKPNRKANYQLPTTNYQPSTDAHAREDDGPKEKEGSFPDITDSLKREPKSESEAIRWQNAIGEAAFINPGALAAHAPRKFEDFRQWVETYRGYGLSLEATCDVISKVLRKKAGDPLDPDKIPKIAYYEGPLTDAAAIKRVEDQPKTPERLMRVKTSIERKDRYWPAMFGDPPTDAEIEAAKHWTPGKDPVPQIFREAG